MKTFKEYASVKSTDGAHVDEDGNLMDLTDDSVIEKLNAFVGSIGIKEYLNPEAAVNELMSISGKPKELCIQALVAAQNIPDVAFEFLMSGHIPQVPVGGGPGAQEE